jgi:alkanesulfonate monooxygenase SsuD/methylene tetrahydromethanopterin reductase-like flavin-dependent oxidoreductase (luciferase family)
MKYAMFSHVQWPETKRPEQAYQEVLEQVQYAEELGFESVWLAEHHFTRYGLAPSPLMLGAYLAAKTSRIRLGTAVTILPLHNMVSLAEQVSMLDVLSGGRVDLGVGRGEPHPSLWANMNIPREESEERFQEALDLLPKLWTTERLAHHGKHHELNDITVVPAAKQEPHPPIYMGVSWNEDRPREAVDRGHGIISGVVLDVEEHLHMRNTYDSYAAELGSDLRAWDCPMFMHTLVADSKQQAVEDAREGLMWMYTMIDFRRTVHHGSDMHYNFPGFAEEHPDPSFTFERITNKKSLLGTPEEVATSIRELNREGGVGVYGCDFGFGGLPHAKVMRSMERFGREVMPRVEED